MPADPRLSPDPEVRRFAAAADAAAGRDLAWARVDEDPVVRLAAGEI